MVAAHRIEHAGPRHAGQVCDAARSQRERGQDQHQPAAVAAGWQPLERQREQQDQQQPDPEHREADAEIRAGHQHPIEAAGGAQRGEQADADAQHDRERHGGECQLRGLGEPLADVLHDGPAGDVAASEVAAQHPAGVTRELHRQRLVELQFRAQPRDGHAVRTLTHHLLHRIAGRDIQQQKDRHQHAAQRRNCEQQAPYEEGHGAVRSMRVPIIRCPLKMVGAVQFLSHGCTAYSSL